MSDVAPPTRKCTRYGHCPSLRCAHAGAVATKEGAGALAGLSSGSLKLAAMALLNAIKYSQAEGNEGGPTAMQSALQSCQATAAAVGDEAAHVAASGMFINANGLPRWPTHELHTGEAPTCVQPLSPATPCLPSDWLIGMAQQVPKLCPMCRQPQANWQGGCRSQAPRW